MEIFNVEYLQGPSAIKKSKASVYAEWEDKICKPLNTFPGIWHILALYKIQTGHPAKMYIKEDKAN